VLPIIDADIYDDHVVIVSEYAPDGSLDVWLKQYGGKAPTQWVAVELVLGILGVLAHLHSRKIIHRANREWESYWKQQRQAQA